MKMYLIALFFGFGSVFALYAETNNPVVTITTIGGGRHGFSTVREIHQGSHSSLVCRDKGYSKAAFQYLPEFIDPVSLYSILDRVEKEIKNGNPTGMIVDCNYKVSWYSNKKKKTQSIRIEFFL